MMKKLPPLFCFLLSGLLILTACDGGNSAYSEFLGKSGGQVRGTVTKEIPDREEESLPELYPAQVSTIGKQSWGYIDSSGKFVLKPEFSSAGRFQSNGTAVVGKDGRKGLINTKGVFLVEPLYQSIGEFSDGLAVVTGEAGFSLMNEQGRIISAWYPYIGQYQEGRAPYYISGPDNTLLYGYLGETGKPVIEPVYQYATGFEGGRAVVQLKEGGYAIIDRDGKRLKTLQYPYVGGLSDGMAVFMPDRNGRYGYLNVRGEVAVEAKFLTAEAFSDGTAVVNAAANFSTNRVGLIDKKGNYLIRPQYNEILQLGEGMVGLGLAIDPKNLFAGSKFALGVRDGTILTDFLYYGISPFRNGIASAYDNTTTRFIDRQGKRVESLPAVSGTGTLELLDGLIYADIDQRPYYMNRQGKVLYRPENFVTLRSGVKVEEERYAPNRNYLVYYPVLSGLKDLKVQESINMRLRDMWIDKGIKQEDNLDYNYFGEFQIGFNRKDLLELQRSAYDYPFGAAHGMPVMEYVHADTRTGAFYRLEDLFKDGSDYVKVLSDILKKQIEEHGEEMGVWPDSYKGIEPDQPFFLSSDALMLYFEPYEIAPYAAGFPTFAVPFEEIRDILDTKGSFWLSFH